jgi:hypothetical protein
MNDFTRRHCGLSGKQVSKGLAIDTADSPQVHLHSSRRAAIHPVGPAPVREASTSV